MEGSPQPQMVGSWLRCYRCWSQELEVQVHYEGIHRIDPVTGERAEVVDGLDAADPAAVLLVKGEAEVGLVVHAVEALHDRLLELVDDLGPLAGLGVDLVDALVVHLHLEVRGPAPVAPEPGPRIDGTFHVHTG